MLLLIDNYDSFTYNLYQYLCELGQEVAVYRNDQITLEDIERLKPERIVISPGPCTPKEAGISNDVIRRYGSQLPILGVCLGHQSIGQVFGGKVVHAKEIMHGKTSQIIHHNTDVFKGLPCPFTATRYHSLVVDKAGLPECLEVTAWTDERGISEIMGLRHRQFPIYGVQFHPESILTDSGHDLLRNFLQLSA
ncbi:MAG: anthranilate synthase component II [Gammaproteobacteria bacterium]|nr:anthranilate synthase component II [Gammaproteobacteria bacterium]